MIRIITFVFLFIAVTVVSILGFRGKMSRREPLILFPDMDVQAKQLPQSQSPFYADKRADRLPPLNTVPRGNALDRKAVFDEAYRADRLRNTAMLTGKDADGNFIQGFPVEVNHQLMEAGRERFDIFCAVCHGLTGEGNGMVRQFPAPTLAPANLLADLYRQQSEGEIFQTISIGKNTMLGYAERLTPEERWAVSLYLRALQRAAASGPESIPDEKRKELGL
jgi:mono/diheme cytochrome c family protein